MARWPLAARVQQASDSHLDLILAPYVLYGVKYIDLVSLAAGPYTRLRTAIPVEAHNLQTVELPDGSIVAFTLGSSEVGGAANRGGPPKDCRHSGPPLPPPPPAPPTCGQRGWAGGA